MKEQMDINNDHKNLKSGDIVCLPRLKLVTVLFRGYKEQDLCGKLNYRALRLATEYEKKNYEWI